jgi:two-component system CheB/CheR fusion protein
VVPELLEKVPATEELRVWVAGCATGEEPYSLAMILYEKLTAAGRPPNLKILATDVHRASLSYASLGFYGDEQLENVSRPRRERFFTRKPGGYQISQDLRQLIVFAPHNVTKDAPFTKMHLISCRNMLIYLEPEAQKTVLSLFHFGLVSGGILFLGSSETTGALAHEFTARDEHWKIYRKRRDVRLLEPLRMPVRKVAAAAPGPLWAPTSRSTSADAQLLATYDQLLDRCMPPSFLVGEDLRLVDSFGGAERMFRLSKRRPSTSILDLLDGELRTIVAAAVQRALKKDGKVRYAGVAIPDEAGVPRRATLTAETLTNARSGVVTVSDRRRAGAGRRRPGVRRRAERRSGRERGVARAAGHARGRAHAHARDAADGRRRAADEQRGAAGHQRGAGGVQRGAAEHQRELHSVNEELYTVNAEYQKKIVELRELNNDMQHFLESSDVGTLFLDRELRIRKYTPRMAGIFHIQSQDVGRSIRDFAHSLKRDSLIPELERALQEGAMLEDEVRAEDSTTFFLRVLPQRPPLTGDGALAAPGIEGVVVSLTDISALERARSRVRQLSAIVESSDDAIIGATREGVITSWNRSAERLYGYSASEAVGREIRTLVPLDCEPELRAVLDAVRHGERVEHLETLRLRKDGRRLDVSAALSPIYGATGEVVGCSAIARDITQLKAAQQELEEREARIRLLLDSTAEAIFGLGRDGTCTFANPACVRILGYASVDALVGRNVHELVHQALPDGSACRDQRLPARPRAAHRRGHALRRRPVPAQRRQRLPGRVLELPGAAGGRGGGRGGHLRGRHGAQGGGRADPGRGAAPRAIPGDALARAAEPAGGGLERHQAAAVRPAERLAAQQGARRDRAPVAPHGAPARRPARRLAHHAR